MPHFTPSTSNDRCFGLVTGGSNDFGAEGGLVVESLAEPDAKDVALLAALEESVADPENAESVPWDVKQRNGL